MSTSSHCFINIQPNYPAFPPESFWGKYKSLDFISEKVSWTTGAYCTCNCTWGPSQHLRFISGSSRLLLTFSGNVKKQLNMHRIKLEIFSDPLDTDDRFSILLFRKIIHLHSVGIVTQIDSTFTSTSLHHTLHSHLHKVLRHFLMTETDGNPTDWEMWKRFKKLGSDFKFPRRRMQLGRREVWIKSDVSNSGDTCDASSLWLISLPHIGIKGAVIKPNNGIL